MVGALCRHCLRFGDLVVGGFLLVGFVDSNVIVPLPPPIGLTLASPHNVIVGCVTSLVIVWSLLDQRRWCYCFWQCCYQWWGCCCYQWWGCCYLWWYRCCSQRCRPCYPWCGSWCPLSLRSASRSQVEGSSGFEEDLCSVASDSQDSLIAGVGASSSEVELGSEPSTPLRSRGPSPSHSAEDVSIKEEDEDDASLAELNGGERSIDEQSVESLDTGNGV